MLFTFEVVQLIGEYAAEWKFAPWIAALPFSLNDNSDFLFENEHPMAGELVAGFPIHWRHVCRNAAEWAADLLLANIDKIADWYHIAYNRNPRVFELFQSQLFSEEEMLDDEMDEMLTTNPLAIDFLCKHPSLLSFPYLGWNPKGDVLANEMNITIELISLWGNSEEWAVDKLLANITSSITPSLSLNTNPRIVAWLIANPTHIDWQLFSQNPTAIDYLRANPQNVTPSIYANSAGIEPLIPTGLLDSLLEFSWVSTSSEPQESKQTRMSDEKQHGFKDKRFLIFGAKTGWIGQKLVDLCELRDLQVVAASSRLENQPDVEKELDNFKPTHVLLAAGLTGTPNVDWCEDHKEQVIRTNVTSTLFLIDACSKRNIHVTNFATGCIFSYDDEHPIGGQGFTEDDAPNFTGSFYSKTKGIVETLLRTFTNCLTLRIRMPISSDLHPRSFVTKILSFNKVVNIPNSMTALDSLLPHSIDLALSNTTGVLNFCNPGTISHNELLELYKHFIDPTFTWTNFSEAECNAILKAKRSNNTLDATKLLAHVPDVPHIYDACVRTFVDMRTKIDIHGKDRLVQRGWKFPLRV